MPAALAVALVAAAMTPIFVVDAFRVLAADWFVRYELGRSGFPADRYGLTGPERASLALTGLHSIQPGGEGIKLLERARLPDGSPAFRARELSHMADVRVRFAAALRAQLAALALLVALAFGLRRVPTWRSVVPVGLLIGSLATLGVAALSVPVILLGFDGFFARFHELLFAGDSWRFADTDTLLRLYPRAFWQDTAQLTAAIVVAQAVAVCLLAAAWLHRVRRPPRGAA